MIETTRLCILDLRAYGPRVVHWTVIRESLMGRFWPENDGLVEFDLDTIRLTDKGMVVANRIANPQSVSDLLF